MENSSVRGNCSSLLLPVPVVPFFSNKLLKVFQTFLFHFSVDFYPFIKNSLQVTLSMFEFKERNVWPACPPEFTSCCHRLFVYHFSYFVCRSPISNAWFYFLIKGRAWKFIFKKCVLTFSSCLQAAYNKFPFLVNSLFSLNSVKTGLETWAGQGDL